MMIYKDKIRLEKRTDIMNAKTIYTVLPVIFLLLILLLLYKLLIVDFFVEEGIEKEKISRIECQIVNSNQRFQLNKTEIQRIVFLGSYCVARQGVKSPVKYRWDIFFKDGTKILLFGTKDWICAEGGNKKYFFLWGNLNIHHQR